MDNELALAKPGVSRSGVWTLLANNEALVFATLILFLSSFYGFIPGFQVHNLGLWYGTWGVSVGLAHQTFPHWFTINDLLIPYGSPQLGGFLVHWFMAALIKFFSIREDIAGDLCGLVGLTIALYGFIRLMRLMEVRRSVGYLCGTIFLLTPFIFHHVDYGSMGLGFMLAPLSVIADLFVVQKIGSPDGCSKGVLLTLVTKVLLIRFLMAGVDWYATVIVMVGGGVIMACNVIQQLVRREKFPQIAAPGIVWGLTWLLGALPWYLAMPSERLSEPFSQDFFRAQGVDLISTIIPKGRFLWGFLFNLPIKWPAFEFYGDNTNVENNYLGIALLISLVAIVVLLAKKKVSKLVVAPVLVSGLVCLILSLGPSLKIDSRRATNKPDSDVITYEDYQMPADQAVMGLPTAFVYKVFPFSMMRGVYRWILFSKIALIISFGLLLEWLLTHDRRAYALALGAFALVEVFPDYPVLFREAHDYYNQYTASERELLNPLRNELSPGDRVFILSTSLENDYLATWIGSRLDVKLFNGGGDKNNWLASPHMPEVIRRLRRYDVRTNDEIKQLVVLALRSGVVDKIVIPYFSMHWDSYNWPPDEGDVKADYKKFVYLDDLGRDSIASIRYRYFSVLSSMDSGSKVHRQLSAQLDSVVHYISNMPESTIFLVDGAKAPLTSLFSGRGDRFFDFRELDVVEPYVRRNVPLAFVLTGFEKYYDRGDYDNLMARLENYTLFRTSDYVVFKLSPLLYYRLYPEAVDEPEDCFWIKRAIDQTPDTSDIAGWSQSIDFSKGDYQEQICRGLFTWEHSNGSGYRWAGPYSTVFLPLAHERPRTLIVSVYPTLNHVPGKVQQFSVSVNGHEVFGTTLTRQYPYTFNIPLGDTIGLGGKVALVSLGVDQSISPSSTDKRELGLIVSQVGFGY